MTVTITNCTFNGVPPEPDPKDKKLDYKHTITFSRNHPLIRLYAWAWDASPYKADFCRLFWGTIFLPLNLIVRVILLPLYLIFLGIAAIGEIIQLRRIERTEKEPEPEPEPPPEEKESSPSRVLTALINFFQRLRFALSFLGTVWRWIRWPLMILITLAVIFAMGLLMFLAAPPVYGFLKDSWSWFALAAAAVAILVACVLGSVAFYDGFIQPRRTEKEKKPFSQTTLGQALVLMKQGAISVKQNTCPRIQLRD